MGYFTGKVAIVTAAGSGMGAGAAKKLAADGFNVAILSSSGKGEALAEELGGLEQRGLGAWCGAVDPRQGVRTALLDKMWLGQGFWFVRVS